MPTGASDLLIAEPARPLLSLLPRTDAASRLERALARRRYEGLLKEFRDRIKADPFGAASLVAAVLEDASVVPPAPGTMRGRLGHWFIRWQSRALWWAVRSFRIRDRALESVWRSLESHLTEHRRTETELRLQVNRLETRLALLEAGVSARESRH